MELSDFDKSRVRYHLGYFTVSVPAGDYARLEEAMNTVPDSFFVDKIIIQIGRCDTAEKKTEVASTPSTRLETIAGDVDRTIRSSNAKDALKIWSEIYLYETNRLAGILTSIGHGIGIGVYATLAVLGLGLILQTNQTVFMIIQIIGLVLLFLFWI